MDELISKRAVIEAIEKARANVGHNMERAVGAAFIEILDDVGEDIGRLPSIQFATDTNVGDNSEIPNSSDAVSRQSVIDLLKQMRKDGDMVPWEGKDVFARIRKLPTIQPETHEERTETHACDLISRQAAIDAIDEISREVDDGYGFDHAKWREYFCELPPAQPKRGRWIKLDMHRGMADHKCSVCEQECYVPTCMGEPMYDFCPNCGADMRGERDDSV